MKMETDWLVSYISIKDSFSHTQPNKASKQHLTHSNQRQTDRQTETQIQTDRQAGRQAGRQADR